MHDGVVGMQDRADSERDRWVRPPDDAEFDLGRGASGRVGDLESRETRVGHRHRDVESVRLVGADHGRERIGEVLLGGGRGEEVDILGGAIEEAVGCTA